MESLVNYESDEDSESSNSKRNHTSTSKLSNNRESKDTSRSDGPYKQRYDSNYENIKMDLSEDSDQGSESSYSDIPVTTQQSGDFKNASNKESLSKDKKSSDRRVTISPQKDRNERENKISRSDDKYRSSDNSSRDKNHRDKDRGRLKHEDKDRSKHRESKRSRDSDSSRRSDKDRRRYREDDRCRSNRSKDSTRHHEERSYRRRSRSRSRSRSRERYYRVNKATQKRQLLEKLGIELQPAESSGGSHSMGEVLTGTANSNSLELPKYYNPGVMNPAKYAQQMQKRKLLWGNKSSSDSKTDDKNSVSNATSGSTDQNVSTTSCSSSTSSNTKLDGAVAKWTNTRFAQDSDGKVASKFMRLMGIKDPTAIPPKSVVPTDDLIKKQEEMFSTMEQQYEVARTVTHTMRGMGLGFGRQF